MGILFKLIFCFKFIYYLYLNQVGHNEMITTLV
jgi:hypothetical protein